MTIKIPVSADFNSGDLDKIIQQFSAQMNQLAKSIAAANNVKFNPIDSSTHEDIIKVQRQFEALKKLSEGFNSRLKATGQSGAGLFDVDFHRLYENQKAGARKALDVLQYVTAGTTFASRMPGPVGSNQGGQQLAQVHGSPATYGWKQMGGSIVSSAVNATGPAGQVISQAVSTGMSQGMKAGLFGLAGGAAALGVGSLISSAREKVSTAQQEMVGYDRLKRALGDVSVGFDNLKGSLRHASDNIWETYDKGQDLAMEFAKIAGLSRDQAGNLAKEVETGGAFSWAYGMDTRQGVNFFAQLRQFKTTSNDADTRRMAVMIGEGIVKSGAFAKAEEMMLAVAGYTANHARSSLSVANVEGYMGALSSMVKSGIPGLDPQGSANILSRANAALAAGGAAGEASQNFIYATLGRKHGLDPIMTKALQETGLLGSGKMAFGKDSAIGIWAEKNGVKIPESAMSDRTNFSIMKEGFYNSYGHNRTLMLQAMSNTFGLNLAQTSALDMMDEGGLGAMQGRLFRLGIDISKVSASGIPTLGNIAVGDDKLLGEIISDLRKRDGDQKLTEDERKKLNQSVELYNATGDVEQLRDVLTVLSATRDMMKTEGSETQRLLAETNNELVRMASTLVEPLNSIKDGVLHIAKIFRFDPAKLAAQRRLDQAEADLKAQKGVDEYNDPVMKSRDNIQSPMSAAEIIPTKDGEVSMYTPLSGGGDVLIPGAGQASSVPRSGGITPKLRVSDAVQSRMEEMLASLPPDVADEYRAHPEFLAMIAQESGWRHYDENGGLLTSKAGARGLGQITGPTGRKPGYGIIPLRDESPAENLRFSFDYYKRMLRLHGGDANKAFVSYNAGPGAVEKYGYDKVSQWDEPRNYVSSINSMLPGTMSPLPDGHDKRFAPKANEASASIHVTGTIQDHRGNEMGSFEPTKTRVGIPVAQGWGS